MKKKRRLLQSDTLWGLMAALLVLLQFWWLPGEDGSAADSYSTTVDGKLGLYRTLNELFPHVSRDASRVVPEPGATLLIVGPDRYPNAGEQEQLFNFVYNGGKLLMAPNWQLPPFRMGSLGIEFATRPRTESVLTSTVSGVPAPSAAPASNAGQPVTSEDSSLEEMLEDSADPASENSAKSAAEGASQPDSKDGGAETATLPEESPVKDGQAVDASSELVEGPIQFHSTATIRILDNFEPEELIVSAQGAVEAATWPMGNGRVVVCSSPDLFSNRSMLHKESRRLAVRLIERCMSSDSEFYTGLNDAIVMSEYFNASDAFQQSGILFSPSLRVGTLQLLLVAALGIWLAFHRFGPAREVNTLQRRSLTESAEAVGNLQYRLRDGGSMIRTYLDYMKSQLRRRYGSLVRLEDARVIANRSGMTVDEVTEKLREASAMAESSQLSPGKTAAMLRWLSGLQQRLSGGKESGRRKTATAQDSRTQRDAPS